MRYHVWLALFFKRLYLFLDRGEGKEKERERIINVWLPLTTPPTGNYGLQLRHVPCLGIEQTTLWFAGWHSVRWATPARATLLIYLNAYIAPALASGSSFNLDCAFLACPCHCLGTSLICNRRPVFCIPSLEISHPPGRSGFFEWETIFGYEDLGTLPWMPFSACVGSGTLLWPPWVVPTLHCSKVLLGPT